MPWNNSVIPPTNVDPMYLQLSQNDHKRNFCQRVYPKLNANLRALLPQFHHHLPIMLGIAFTENLRDKSLQKLQYVLRYQGDGYYTCPLCLSIMTTGGSKTIH